MIDLIKLILRWSMAAFLSLFQIITKDMINKIGLHIQQRIVEPLDNFPDDEDDPKVIFCKCVMPVSSVLRK